MSLTTPPVCSRICNKNDAEGGRFSPALFSFSKEFAHENVKYGKCVKCGKTYEAVPNLTTCECGGILDIIYDYDYIKTQLTKEKLASRNERTMWRYRELLPVEETTAPTPLRVGWSPCTTSPVWRSCWA